jgi:uncharacterized membrane protein
MQLDPSNLAAIAGMAVVTFLCRGGGYWLFRQIRPTPFLRSVLGYIPGTLFVAYVTPSVLAGGVQALVGSAAALAAMLATRNLSWAIIAGTAGAWVVWWFH